MSEITTPMQARFDAGLLEHQVDVATERDMDRWYRELFPEDITLDQFRSLWQAAQRAARQPVPPAA